MAPGTARTIAARFGANLCVRNPTEAYIDARQRTDPARPCASSEAIGPRRAWRDPLPGAPPKPETIASDPIASAEWDRMAGLLKPEASRSQADLGIPAGLLRCLLALVAARTELARDGLIVSTAVGAAKLNPAATAAAVAARELRTAAAELGATPTARAGSRPPSRRRGTTWKSSWLGEPALPDVSLRSKSTAFGRATRRASSDPACIPL